MTTINTTTVEVTTVKMTTAVMDTSEPTTINTADERNKNETVKVLITFFRFTYGTDFPEIEIKRALQTVLDKQHVFPSRSSAQIRKRGKFNFRETNKHIVLQRLGTRMAITAKPPKKGNEITNWDELQDQLNSHKALTENHIYSIWLVNEDAVKIYKKDASSLKSKITEIFKKHERKLALLDYEDLFNNPEDLLR